MEFVREYLIHVYKFVLSQHTQEKIRAAWVDPMNREMSSPLFVQAQASELSTLSGHD